MIRIRLLPRTQRILQSKAMMERREKRERKLKVIKVLPPMRRLTQEGKELRLDGEIWCVCRTKWIANKIHKAFVEEFGFVE